MKLSKVILPLVCTIFIIGCETETEYAWDENSRINEYVTWIDGTICCQTVDFLF